MAHLSPLGFAACQSKKCTNRAMHQFKGVHLSQVHRPSSAPTEYMNVVCFVGGWVKTHE